MSVPVEIKFALKGKFDFGDGQGIDSSKATECNQTNDEIKQSNDSKFVTTCFFIKNKWSGDKENKQLDNGDGGGENGHLQNIRPK